MAVGVGASLGANLPQNYAEWTAYQRRAGKLGTGKGQIAPNQMKTAFDAYVKNHGIVTPAAQRAAAAQQAQAQEAARQQALANQPSAVDFNQESGDFQRLNGANLAELRRYAGVEETSPGVWGLTGTGELQRNRANALAQNDISRAQLDEGLKNSLLSVARNAAARGIGRSGIKANNLATTGTQYDTQYKQLAASDEAAKSAESNGVANAITQYFLSTFGAQDSDKANAVINALKAKGIIT